MKVAVVGSGYWGKNHVRNYSELKEAGEVEEVTICDINLERAKELGEKYDMNYTTNLEDILIDESIKAVSLATPTNAHFKLGKKIMKSGKDILIEKPLALRSQEAENLLKIAEREDRILEVGHIFRYHPAVNELKKKIGKNEFGRIFHIISNRLSFRNPRKSMGVLHALAVHEIDIFEYLLEEEAVGITCIDRSNVRRGVGDTAFLTLEFPSGSIGHAVESWMVPVFGKKRELIIVGEKKSALVDYLKSNKITIFEKRVGLNGEIKILDGDSYAIEVEDKEPLKEEIKDFITCVKERKTPRANGRVGLRAVKMIEKAIESNEKKKTIQK